MVYLLRKAREYNEVVFFRGARNLIYSSKIKFAI